MSNYIYFLNSCVKREKYFGSSFSNIYKFDFDLYCTTFDLGTHQILKELLQRLFSVKKMGS